MRLEKELGTAPSGRHLFHGGGYVFSFDWLVRSKGSKGIREVGE